MRASTQTSRRPHRSAGVRTARLPRQWCAATSADGFCACAAPSSATAAGRRPVRIADAAATETMLYNREYAANEAEAHASTKVAGVRPMPEPDAARPVLPPKMWQICVSRLPPLASQLREVFGRRELRMKTHA